MKKILGLSSILSICFLVIACSSEEPVNESPTAVQLMYPTQNLLCTTRSVPFDWTDATDAEDDFFEYNLIVAKDRELTNVVENRKVPSSQSTLILEKSTAYYWQVITVDVLNEQQSSSSVFAFYTTGDGVENYAPFMANLKRPENNTIVSAENIDLVWEGADINTADTLTYELYFGESGSLSLLDNSISGMSYSVSVISGKTYSWKVNVKDNWGAKSIGQIFTFSVN